MNSTTDKKPTFDDVWLLFQENRLEMKEVAKRFKENQLEMKEVAKRFQETDQKFEETDRRFKETDRQLKELGKQIGGLGNKFGSFTEGMAWPSLERLLRERFGMENIYPNAKFSWSQGQRQEVDVLAWSNGELNRMVVVEIKSHASEESIDQLLTILQRVRMGHREHQEKALYGVLAAVHLSDKVIKLAFARGLHVASLSDDHFTLLDEPPGFSPVSF
jgi:hypothetical protein